jgi:hypothetical protein
MHRPHVVYVCVCVCVFIMHVSVYGAARKTLLSDMLNELRNVSSSLDDDAWKFEGDPNALG